MGFVRMNHGPREELGSYLNEVILLLVQNSIHFEIFKRYSSIYENGHPSIFRALSSAKCSGLRKKESKGEKQVSSLIKANKFRWAGACRR
jgi:hypothetical protein